jgi:DNA polymerase V
MTRGGRRIGAGRKVGSGQYGETTKVMRIPQSRIEEVKMILQFPNKIKPEPGKTKISEVFFATLNSFKPQPLYTTMVSAGIPLPTDDYSEGKLDLNEHLLQNPETTFFVRVSGDSMIEASIHPGDLLIVDRSLPPASGKIVIAVVNGELTVKRLFKERGKLFLMPENPNYPTLEITEEMAFMIWGVVTNVIHPV